MERKIFFLESYHAGSLDWEMFRDFFRLFLIFDNSIDWIDRYFTLLKNDNAVFEVKPANVFSLVPTDIKKIGMFCRIHCSISSEASS